MRSAAGPVLHAVEALGLYRDVQTLYQRTLNRGYWRERVARRRLLERFVHPGDLVFDIGANLGGYVTIFLDLRARVVAVEANPALAELLQRRYRIPVEAVAVGADAGEAVLHLGKRSGHSTISERWVEHAPTQDRWSGESVSVRKVPLDDLVARYGEPDFAKVDVEGAEADVLRGSSRPLRAMSVEFQAADLAVTEECLAILDGWGAYDFWLADAGSSDLEEHGDSGSVRRRLRELAETDSRRYGDVYVRHAR